jgi:hypothetical protein
MVTMMTSTTAMLVTKMALMTTTVEWKEGFTRASPEGFRAHS